MARAKKEKVDATKKVEAIVLEMGKAIEGKLFKGETFEIQKTTHGILYHVYGGFSIFVTPNNNALYETLNDLIENQEEYSKLTGQERDDFELNLSAIAYVLDVPLMAFSSAEFTFKIAEETIKYLKKAYEDALNNPLHEETIEDVEANSEFEESVKAMENIQKALKEEHKD